MRTYLVLLFFLRKLELPVVKKTVSFDVKEVKPKLVVEANNWNGQPPIVFLSNSSVLLKGWPNRYCRQFCIMLSFMYPTVQLLIAWRSMLFQLRLLFHYFSRSIFAFHDHIWELKRAIRFCIVIEGERNIRLQQPSPIQPNGLILYSETSSR